MNSEQQIGGGSELGSFLRARRARVTPEDVGLTAGSGLRRTPGLRREELATLAGISIDYYVRLERGKETRPSASVVDSLARALLLGDDELEHLRILAARAARPNRPPRRPARRETAPGESAPPSRATPTAAKPSTTPTSVTSPSATSPWNWKAPPATAW